MSTRTAQQGMSSQASSRLSLVDVVCLVATVALLVSFVVLPWAIDAGTSVTGLSLLLSESPPLTPEVSVVLSEIRWALLLVPLATFLAGLGLFLQLTGRAERRWVTRLLPVAGLVGFAYFAMYFIHDGQTPLLLMQYTGVGFWIACFASGILFLQHLASRSTVSTRASAARPGIGQRMRRTAGKLVEGPRANQAVSSVFRFQSLFGLFIVIVLAIIISPTRDDSILFLNQRNLSNVARDVSETGILAVPRLAAEGPAFILAAAAALPSGIGQQLLYLIGLFAPLEALCGRSDAAAVVAALVFGLVHVPLVLDANHGDVAAAIANAVLFQASVGLVACLAYQRHRAAVPIGIAHALAIA